jgi:hypothetical protein
MKNDSIFPILILLGLAALCGLGSGCATTGDYSPSEQREIGYEKFFDSYGEYRLVKKNNDVWKEKLDGSESTQITHTPNVSEDRADFFANGTYVGYAEEVSHPYHLDFFLVPSKSDDSQRKKVSVREYINLAGQKSNK